MPATASRPGSTLPDTSVPEPAALSASAWRYDLRRERDCHGSAMRSQIVCHDQLIPARAISRAAIAGRRGPVEDHGAGLPVTDAPIFEPFFTAKRGGTGSGSRSSSARRPITAARSPTPDATARPYPARAALVGGAASWPRPHRSSRSRPCPAHGSVIPGSNRHIGDTERSSRCQHIAHSNAAVSAYGAIGHANTALFRVPRRTRLGNSSIISRD